MKTNLCKKTLSSLASRDGSTIAAVMVSMVFIGIVTASMLKNTGTQSAASMGHGSVLALSSTASSGVMATQRRMRSTTPAEDIAKRIDPCLTNWKACTSQTAQNNLYVLGSNTQKVSLGTNQAFSSRIARIFTPGNRDRLDSVFARLEVNTGKNTGARNLKQALAFGKMSGLLRDPPTTNTNNWPTLASAASFGGGFSGNNGLVVPCGNVTFGGDVVIQNKPFQIGCEPVCWGCPVPPHCSTPCPSGTSVGTTWVKGDFRGLTGNSYFGNHVYIEGQMSMQNNAATTPFSKNVGVEGNWHTGGGSGIGVGGNAYIRGESWDPIRFPTYHHTGGSTPATKLWVPTGKFNGAASDMYGTNIKNTSPANMWGQTKAPAVANLASTTNIPTTIGMGSANYAKRTENEVILNLSTQSITNERPSVKIFTDADVDAAKTVNSPNKLDVNELNRLYNETKKNNPEQLYNDHIVVRVRRGCNWGQEEIIFNDKGHTVNCGGFGGVSAYPTGATFNGKVMFILDDGAYFSTSDAPTFYTSGAQSSTLVYAGPGTANINIGNNTTFRGLVYTHPQNTQSHNIRFGGEVEGAINMLGSGHVMHNTDGSKPLTVKFNPSVLGNYLPNTSTGTGPLKISDAGITFIPYGYYFR